MLPPAKQIEISRDPKAWGSFSIHARFPVAKLLHFREKGFHVGARTPAAAVPNYRQNYLRYHRSYLLSFVS